MVVSGQQGSSDSQAVAALSDALISAASTKTAVQGHGEKIAQWASSAWEPVIDAFLSWVAMEGGATKCADPLSPQNANGEEILPLQDTVVKHLAFHKVSESWAAMCCCGEHRHARKENIRSSFYYALVCRLKFVALFCR